jgi:pyruvate kinase
VPYARLAHDVRKGDRILLDDGTKELEVLGVNGSTIKTKVLLGGRLLSFKGINVPSVTLSVESMTKKDEEDLEFGLKQNIDFVALSFVRNAEDVTNLRAKIKKYLPEGIEPPAIIVKIEKHEALQNFDAILAETDAVMIARGDLGLETPATAVPLRQKELIAKCVVANKPVITATQMLDSMQRCPRPTRAEVSDVANAVIDHTDAVMLSGETAMGQYPEQAVLTMAEIIQQTEESPLDNLLPHCEAVGEPVPLAIAAAAVELARHISAAAILVTTHSGFSARAISRFRSETPVFAATDMPRSRQQMLLSWGINPIDVGSLEHPDKMASLALEELKKKHQIKKGDEVVVISGLKRPEGGYDSAIRIVEI